MALSVLQSTIQDKICPRHKVYPVVEISEKEIQIVCCCHTAHEECIRVAQYMLTLAELDEVYTVL